LGGIVQSALFSSISARVASTFYSLLKTDSALMVAPAQVHRKRQNGVADWPYDHSYSLQGLR
jgi:hypothetical protein